MYTPIHAGLAAKLNAAMADVGYIQKDKRNSSQGYNYASEAAIKAAFHKAFATHGIQFYWSTDGAQMDKYEIEGSNGTRTVFQATIKCTYRFIDMETGEYIEGMAMGVGQDSGDKAIYKAITGAIKYALTANFLVETGDDPEEDEDEATISKNVSKVSTIKSEVKTNEEPTYEATENNQPTCTSCQEPLTNKVAAFSIERYGKLLCFEHQKKA